MPRNKSASVHQIPLAHARAEIERLIQPLDPETGMLGGVHGRILREDIFSPEDLPGFDRSAMDGYAVGLDDDSARFEIVGEVQPGSAAPFEISRGQCARVFTGAAIPVGASQVIIQEEVDVEGNTMIPKKRKRTTFIRQRGEDARAGEKLLTAGTRLQAGELSLLASIGQLQTLASPIVRVVHWVTGNELVHPVIKPGPGEIRDSNSTLVASMVQEFGGRIVQQERLRDDLPMLLQKARTLDGFDLLLISGGASVGDYDYGREILAELGFTIHFEQVALRPGKPLIFATKGRQAAFVLPGNPVSHYVVLQLAVRLAFERFTAAPVSWPLVNARLAGEFEFRPDPRETFWPGRVTIENGDLVARAHRWQSSGDLHGLAGANALLQILPDGGALAAGAVVKCLLLDPP